MTVTGTSTFQGPTIIDDLNLGELTFAADSGIVALADMPVTSNATAGTAEQFRINIDGNSLLTIAAEADGAGGIRNAGVSVGTSTLVGLFNVGSSTNYLTVASSTGYVGIGTSAPSTTLTVVGTFFSSGTSTFYAAANFSGAIRASSTLEVTGASNLSTVSSTQLTVSGNTNLSTLQTSGAIKASSTLEVTGNAQFANVSSSNVYASGLVTADSGFFSGVQTGTYGTAFLGETAEYQGGNHQTGTLRLGQYSGYGSVYSHFGNHPNNSNFGRVLGIDVNAASTFVDPNSSEFMFTENGYFYAGGGRIYVDTDSYLSKSNAVGGNFSTFFDGTETMRIGTGLSIATSTIIGDVIGGVASTTLHVIGTVKATGAIQASSTLEVTGNTQLANVSSTNLHVIGNLRVTASTTFGGVAYSWPSSAGSASQVLTTDGSGNLSWATASAGGAGAISTSSAITANYFPYWANATGGLSGTSSLAYSAGDIGIGTTVPSSTLHVVGTFKTTGASTLANVSSTELTVSGNTNLSTVQTSGKLLVGTSTTPLDLKLGVYGGAVIGANYINSGSDPSANGLTVEGNVMLGSSGVSGAKLYVNGTTYIASTLQVGATSTMDSSFVVDTNTLYADAGSNSVGIGTIAPSSTLHVAGTFQVTSTSTLSTGNVISSVSNAASAAGFTFGTANAIDGIDRSLIRIESAGVAVGHISKVTTTNSNTAGLLIKGGSLTPSGTAYALNMSDMTMTLARHGTGDGWGDTGLTFDSQNGTGGILGFSNFGFGSNMLVSLDAASPYGGDSGFIKTAASGGNFSTKYDGTEVQRFSSATNLAFVPSVVIGDVITATASNTLQVVGTFSASATSTLASVSASGAIRASSTLEVTGATQLGNTSTTNAYVNGTLAVTGTSYLQNVSSSGNLSTTGTIYSGNDLTVNGNTRVGRLYTSAFIMASTTLDVTGATILGSTLQVGGATTLLSGLTGTTATFSGAVTASSTLQVTGASQFANVSSTNIYATGNANFATLQTSATTTLGTGGQFVIVGTSTTPTANFEVSGANSSFNSSLTRAIPSWATSTVALPVSASEHSIISANGYLYMLAGTTVYYTKIKADGTVGAWVTSAQAIPSSSARAVVMVYNGYLYSIGGTGASSVYYTKINSDGSIGTWQTNANTLPANRSWASGAAANGYLYITGGATASTGLTTVYYAKVNASGSVNAWSTDANALPAGRFRHRTTAMNGYLYVIGGELSGDSSETTVYYAKINANGTLNAWATNANAMATANLSFGLTSLNGNLYAIGGYPNATVVQSARVNSDGTTGVWSATTALPVGGWDLAVTSANGYVYVAGGTGGGGTVMYVGSTPRLKIAGTLDLLGMSSTSLTDAAGEGGSSIFAASGYFANNLEVANNAQFWNGLSVNGPVNISVGTSTTPSPIFHVFATSTNSIFTIMNTGNVGIGTSTPGTLFVVNGTSTMGDILPLASSTYNLGSAALPWKSLYVSSSTIYLGGIPLSVNSSGQLLVSGSTVGGGSSGSVSTSSAVTANYFPFWSASTGTMSGTSTIARDTSGNIGIGTTAPSSSLHIVGTFQVTATSTFSGGTTIIDDLQVGASMFEANAGQVSWMDMPVTSSSTIGTVHSYTAQMDGNPILTVYGVSTGGGAAYNLGLGVGTTTPAYMLHVVSTSSAVAAFERSIDDGTLISLRQGGTEEGTISVSGTTISYNAFTGSHYGIKADKAEEMKKGDVIVLTGNNQYLNNNAESEILYGITKSTKANDSMVLGSYLALQEPNKDADNSNPELVMAVGNGDVWVVDNGQDVAVGDYLITSDVAGHAMKDLRTATTSYVFARASENIKWSDVTDVVGEVKHKKIAVFFEGFARDNAAASALALQNSENPSNVPTTAEIIVDRLTVNANFIVKGRVTFNKDTVGRAKILAGAQEVRVTFAQEYANQPIVNVTPMGSVALDVNFKYTLTGVDATGFTIALNNPAYEAVTFNWMAFASADDAQIFVSDGTQSLVNVAVVEVAPAPEIVIPDPIVVTPESTPTPISESTDQPTDSPATDSSGTASAVDSIVPTDGSAGSPQAQPEPAPSVILNESEGPATPITGLTDQPTIATSSEVVIPTAEPVADPAPNNSPAPSPTPIENSDQGGSASVGNTGEAVTPASGSTDSGAAVETTGASDGSGSTPPAEGGVSGTPATGDITPVVTETMPVVNP
jgi:hypothetical protein